MTTNMMKTTCDENLILYSKECDIVRFKIVPARASYVRNVFCFADFVALFPPTRTIIRHIPSDMKRSLTYSELYLVEN